MSVDSKTRHCQALTVTMLAIATGALGFGLFGAEFRISTEPLPVVKLAAGGLALLCWMALAESVNAILRKGAVTGLQVARGPLRTMFLVVVYVVSVFVIGIFDGPPPA